MQVHTFLAESVADAVAQLRETLGPEAVVLNVRRLPVEGFARLWQKPRIEVLAHVPEPSAARTACTGSAGCVASTHVRASRTIHPSGTASADRPSTNCPSSERRSKRVARSESVTTFPAVGVSPRVVTLRLYANHSRVSIASAGAP